MKKIFLMFCMICICMIFNSCGQNQPKIEKAKISEYNINELGKEIESEIYDTSGQNSHEWGGGIVENSEYIFFTSENAVVQIKKDTMEKTIIRQREKESIISLYCTERELYYIQDMREVYLISLENGKQQLICSSEMLEKPDNPFRYCGEYYDKETESIYLRARYYQPVVGRFLTRDTYTGESDEPLSLHLYTYCGNDGVNAWDPDGNVWTSIKNKWNSLWNSAKKYYNTAKSYVKKFVNNPKKTSAELIRKGVDSWKDSWFGKKIYGLTKSGKSKLFNGLLIASRLHKS